MTPRVRLLGIPLRVETSFLLVFALVAWSLASYFPHAVPSLSPLGAWLEAVAAAILLFACVLAHELAHAILARRHGVRVGGITLHVFGGISELEDEPPSPRVEVIVALAGPVASAALALLALAARGALPEPAWAHALLAYLAAVNLLVAGFNLVPGYPLDGGRVVRAALWAWRGDEAWATRTAGRVGVTVSVALIAIGTLRALAGGIVGGMWLALVGMFLHQSARSSVQMAELRQRLERVRVADVMSPPDVRDGTTPSDPDRTVAPDDSAWLAVLRLARTRSARIAVVDGAALVGTIDRDDLRRASAREDAAVERAA